MPESLRSFGQLRICVGHGNGVIGQVFHADPRALHRKSLHMWVCESFRHAPYAATVIARSFIFLRKPRNMHGMILYPAQPALVLVSVLHRAASSMVCVSVSWTVQIRPLTWVRVAGFEICGLFVPKAEQHAGSLARRSLYLLADVHWGPRASVADRAGCHHFVTQAGRDQVYWPGR
jgi:hypothetical protein